jgi:DNA-binding NarL/FixJ family response regulator
MTPVEEAAALALEFDRGAVMKRSTSKPTPEADETEPTALRGDEAPKIQLLIASEHPIARTALGKLLNAIPDFEVVGEVGFSRMVKAAGELSPEVFLIDLTESGLADVHAVAALMRAAPSAGIAVLSSNENPTYLRSMLAMGIKGYVVRSASNSELYEAIRTVHRGKRYIDPRLSDSIADMLIGSKTGGIRKPQVKRLSGREAQVLRAIAQGFTAKAIAVKLDVSERTIQTYRERIYEKLELRTRADLVHYAIAHGMLNSLESES